MLKYSATLSSAKAYAAAGKLDAWIHLYLNEDGRNIPFSDGLKLFDRFYFSQALFPIRLFHRCAGPEPEMKYRIDKDWWAIRVADLEKSIQNDPDMPPLIVHYVAGEFELNDGNHRHQAYENLGIENAWVILWITEEAEKDDIRTKQASTGGTMPAPNGKGSMARTACGKRSGSPMVEIWSLLPVWRLMITSRKQLCRRN